MRWSIAVLCALSALPLAGQSLPPARFHHLHLNTTDPAAAIEFYTRHFDCEKARFAGVVDAVWVQKSWLLFHKVAEPPPWELTSAIWHFGWGAEDMKAAYRHQIDLGARFFTPLTDIRWLASREFYYAYVLGPDHALIELNTAAHHHFGHLHLFSEDPVAAGEWYEKYLGVVRRGSQLPSREPRFHDGVQFAPSVSLMAGNVNIVIYPIQYSKTAYKDQWGNGQSEMSSTKGRVVDHVGFSFENLPQALETLRRGGVQVTDEVRTAAGGKIKYAFIEGPDKIRIELVEGQPRRDDP